MSNKEMTNYEKIEALRKKANIIIAVDGGLRMIGAPILGTLTVLGINKKFVQEESLFKTNKTIALGAESILVSNAIEGAMSAVTKRILTKIAENIDSLAAADEEADEVVEDDIFMENDHVCSCGGDCQCHGNIDDDGVIEDNDDDNCICCNTDDFIAAKELIEKEYNDYRIIKVVFQNEDYADKSCFPLVRHFVTDGTIAMEERVHNLIKQIANTVGEHTTPDDEEWNEEPAKYSISSFTMDYVIANCGNIDDIITCAEMLISAKKLINEYPTFTSAYCREYDKVGIYTNALLELEDSCAANNYESSSFGVEIKYTLPDGSTDTATVDIEENSPIFAVSEVFDIFQLVAGCENNVDCVVLTKIVRLGDDEEEETEDNVEPADTAENEINNDSNGGNE